MLSIKFIQQNPDVVKKECENRNIDCDVDLLLKLSQEKKSLQQDFDKLRSEQNQFSQTLKGRKPSDDDIARMKDIKNRLQIVEDELREKGKECSEILYKLPNISHESTPIGKNEEENVVVKKVGKLPNFDFKPKSHWELSETLNLFDSKKGADVSGARFWYFKNELVELEFALIQYAMDKMKKYGFQAMLPPVLVKEKAMFGTGFFPAEKNQIYEIPPKDSKEEALYLVGTSEVPLINYHADEIIDIEKPIQYLGVSSCFRREAGSYGKDTKGWIRGHQFEKVEMIVFCHPEQSWDMHEKLLAIEEEIYQELEIPYQVVNICTGDLGAPASKKYDIEGWFPSQKKYRELTSTSNTTDFQSRRLNIKFQDSDGSKKFVHTLNGTAITPRALAAVLENNQRKDGSIEIPKALHPYVSLRKIG